MTVLVKCLCACTSLTAGIGNTGEILPLDYNADDLKNLVSCIISSGVLLLDTYYNLSQREVRKMDISNIQNFFELSHFKLQHLFCWRQRLFDCNKRNTLAFKPHGCCHFFWYIPEFGAPPNNDTVVFEHMHIINVKQAYKASSKRTSTSLEEMTSRIQFRHLARALHTHDERSTQEKRPSSKRSISYETESDLIYEASVSTAFRDEVTFVNASTCMVNKRFLNPNVSMPMVWAAMKRSDNPDVVDFLNDCQRFLPGITQIPN